MEEQAKQQEKNLSCTVILIVLLSGFLSGLYYWFINPFIFNYSSISPFLGFIIFSLLGVLLLIIIGLCFSNYWKEYNQIIQNSNKDIKTQLQNFDCSSGDLFRIKKDYIERKIGREPLTKEEFEWHSKHFCWGCGREQKVEPISYTVTKDRIVSWKKGAFRHTQTFKGTGKILICPECYTRLTKADHVVANNNLIRKRILIGIYAIITISVFFYACYTELNNNDYSIFRTIIEGTLIAFVCLCMALSLGKIILIPLANLLALPFINTKDCNTKTKWNFDEIPQIRKFMHKKIFLIPIKRNNNEALNLN